MDSLSHAVLATVVYSDLFNQPLTIAELHRYLHGCRIERSRLEAALADGLLAMLPIEMVDDLLVLHGDVEKVRLRTERRQISAGLFPAALRYARFAARLPFVRMLALTGGLAVENASEADDIDYLVITEPGRIWTSRLFFLFLVKLSGLRGITLCPNYFLDANSLALTDHSIFTARELAQMVPLAGMEIYARMRAANPWTDDCLPNAAGPPGGNQSLVQSGHTMQPVPTGLTHLPVQTGHTQLADQSGRTQLPGHPVETGSREGLFERALAGSAGDRLEGWERKRKVRKLSAEQPPTDEIAFDERRVQGHFEGYRARTLAEFDRRMKAYA